MSMFNVVFGDQSNRMALAGLVGFKEEPLRFRSAWVETDGDMLRIAIYTRMGGGNRAEDQSEPGDDFHDWYLWWESVPKMPLYLFDKDDDFDCTYATLYFRAPTPAEMVDMAKEVGQEISMDTAEGIFNELLRLAGEPVDTSKMWLDAIEKIKAQ